MLAAPILFLIPISTFLNSQIFFDEIKLINKEEWIFLSDYDNIIISQF